MQGAAGGNAESSAEGFGEGFAEGFAEGTIRFAYGLRELTRPVDPDVIAELNAWRHILFDLRLVGQDADRYDGFGFGNLSARDPEDPDAFIVTSSQTGHIPSLGLEHYVRVAAANIERFWVDAQGTLPPSSESLTHAAMYASDPRVRFVFHIHSPEIFGCIDDLRMPATSAAVQYGTPQMAAAVSALFEKHVSRPIVFASRGHEDGIFACGQTSRDTGALLVTALAKALAADSGPSKDPAA